MKALLTKSCLLLSLVVFASAPALWAQTAPPALEVRPITLSQALLTALQNNLALRIALFEVQVTQAQLAQALAARSGALTGTLGYTRTSERVTSFVIPANAFGPGLPPVETTITFPVSPNVYVVNLGYQYPVYSGGRLEAQIALARAGVKGAEAALERTKQEVALQTKRAYFQVLVAQAGLQVAQQNVAQAEETLRIAQARVRAGTSPRFDEIQAEVNLANARQGLLRARNGVAVATQGLAAILALPLDAALHPQETMEVVPVTASLADLVARGLRERPELAEHQAKVEAAEAALELARTGGRPVVGLSGGLSLDGLGTGAVALGWSIGLAATFPLFDGGITAAKIREAELRLEQLKVVGAQLRQSIELQVRQGVLNLGAAAEEVSTARAAIEQAREALRIAQVRFREGVGTNLEVISAQAALAQAEGARVQALFSYNTARAQLERAVGGPVQ
ncbi:MAG: TolC family protein [Armatimonadota bacterium]|nr:TolC family protein [Armatimonadota bacterium]MDR7464599.1 TolC family protein [Armatimonadota bacterium]